MYRGLQACRQPIDIAFERIVVEQLSAPHKGSVDCGDLRLIANLRLGRNNSARLEVDDLARVSIAQ